MKRALIIALLMLATAWASAAPAEAGLDQLVQGLQTQVNTLNSQLNALQSRLEALNSGLMSRVGALTTQDVALASQIATVSADIARLATASAMSEIASQVSTLTSQVSALQTQNSTLTSKVGSLTAQVNTLQTQLIQVKANPALALGPYIAVDPNPENGLAGPHVIFYGANVHILSGSGQTQDTTGLGNLVIGYNEDSRNPGEIDAHRTGSHNLVAGSQHRFTASGGFVAGFENSVLSDYATVTGGDFNTASGAASSVSGGGQHGQRLLFQRRWRFAQPG